VIVPSLLPLATPLEQLRTMKGNARKGDVEAVSRSLARFGQRKPVVANSNTGEVIAGNHTLMAAQRLGWDTIAVVWVEDDPVTAKAFALADNRTAELGGYDNELLAAMIEEVLEADAGLLGDASYTEADLAALLADTAPPVPGEPAPDSKPAPIKLLDRFMGLPFTVFNSREGWWQERKRAWTDLGIESELGRDDKPRTWNIAPPPGHGHGDRPLVEGDARG
jgi:hypothetical protein